MLLDSWFFLLPLIIHPRKGTETSRCTADSRKNIRLIIHPRKGTETRCPPQPGWRWGEAYNSPPQGDGNVGAYLLEDVMLPAYNSPPQGDGNQHVAVPCVEIAPAYNSPPQGDGNASNPSPRWRKDLHLIIHPRKGTETGLERLGRKFIFPLIIHPRKGTET